jgi:Dolichyl-phosphate-mannose-protein mannosyltransferase
MSGGPAGSHTSANPSIAVRRSPPHASTVRARSVSGLAGWRYLDASLLGSAIVVMTVLNMVWVELDKRSPYWDMARHLGDSLVTKDSFSFAHPLRFLTTYVYYPPFVYWVTDAFYLVLGTAQWVAILSQAAFLAVLVYSTYGIGKILWNRQVGLVSAFFVATTPMFVSMFKWYMLDAPLAAMAALALYLLIRSDSFSSRRFSLLFGGVCGLGMLTKWTFPLVFWLPVAAALVAPLRTTFARRSWRPLVNPVAAGLLAFAICGPWFVHNYSQLRTANALFNKRAAAIEGDPSLGSLQSVLWYAWNLLDEQLYLIPFLAFLAGLVFVFRKNESASRNYYPMLTVVGSYVAFTLLDNKDYRFTMGMLPAVAVVAVSWLQFLRPRLRHWLTGGILAYGAVAFLAVSFGTGLVPKDWMIRIKPRSYTSDLVAFTPGYDAGSATRAQGITLFAQHGWLVGPPSHEQWHQGDAFRDIAGRAPNNAFAFTGGDSIWFNTWGTRYYSLKYNLPWVLQGQARFLVVRGPVPLPPAGFRDVRQYRLPDGEPLTVFERQ